MAMDVVPLSASLCSRLECNAAQIASRERTPTGAANEHALTTSLSSLSSTPASRTRTSRATSPSLQPLPLLYASTHTSANVPSSSTVLATRSSPRAP